MINILLIDDKPESLYKSPGNEEIPVLDKEEGIFYDELKLYFNLKWLQSPEDIKDYRDFSNIIDDFHGHNVLNKEGFIPEIIVFDYNLGKGMNDTVELEKDNDLKRVVPNFEMAKKLGAKISRKRPENLINEFNEEIESNRKKNSDEENKLKDGVEIQKILLGRNIQRPVLKEVNDNLGCFAGGLIALQFKDHPCIGIPTTSKSEDDIKGTEATIFEWWLDYDFNGLFNLKHRTNPQWKELIPKAVVNLREKIKQLVKGGKVNPSLLELIEVANCSIAENRKFTFSSAYGIKHLPLDGLFIDKASEVLNPTPEEVRTILEKAKKDGKISKVEITERDYEIWKFASGLLKTLAEASGIETNTISQAKKIAEDLWTAATGDVLKERFKLSQLFAKKFLMNSKLNEEETELLERYCSADYYDVSDCAEIVSQIKGVVNGKSPTLKTHVRKKVFSIREHHKNGEKYNKIKIVLSTLFLALDWIIISSNTEEKIPKMKKVILFQLSLSVNQH